MAINGGQTPLIAPSGAWVHVDADDASGQERGFATRAIQQFHPRADCYEQSSADIWTQLAAAVRGRAPAA
jgi:ribulose kinase